MAEFGSGFDAGADAGTMAPVPPPIATPQPEGGGFGSALAGFGNTLKGIFGGPQYKPADPEAAPLDAAADLLKQRVKRANAVATNPLAEFFAPEQAAAARDFIPQATQQLQQVEQERQRAADVKATARNWGLTNPGQFGPQATDTTLHEEALRQWKEEGNFNAYKALSGASPEWKTRADLYMPEAMQKFSQHVEGVRRGMTTLDAADRSGSEDAYKAARNKVIRENDLQAIGVKPEQIPATLQDWRRVRGSLAAQYNQAERTINAFNARQDQLNQAVPITNKDVRTAIEGPFKHTNGEQLPGFSGVSLPGYGDVQGVQGPPGSKDRDNFGRTWSTAAPEQVETVRKQMGADEVKGAVSKYKMSRDFYNTVSNDKLFKSAAGLALISDELGAIGRDVAEGTKAAGSIGLTKMLEAKYGTVDIARNRIRTEISALKEWMGKPPSDRLSPPSIAGIKAVAEFKHGEALKELSDRIGQPLETAGRYGMPLKDLGLDKEVINDPALRGTYDSELAQSRRTLKSYPMVPIGDTAVLLPKGSNIQGAIPPQADTIGAPPATDRTAPGAAPVQPSPPAPEPRNPSSGGPPPSGPGAPTAAPGGGTPTAPPPTPLTIAGQQINVSLPPGASPNFVPALQRIESGDLRDPWTAGAKTSSASGAFQAIKATWDRFKPPGAPNRAADATPQQQADFFSNFTNHNATVLKNAGLPVNDTTLYVTHNLGEAGGPRLLNAPLDADARTVVGEAAAQNNPAFFRGRPTVAVALQRYQEKMGEGEGEPREPNPPLRAAEQDPRLAPARTARQERAARNVDKYGPGARAPWEISGELGDFATEHAPAIGSTAGALAGMAGGVPGMVAGGAAGGAAGQAAKDYLRGNPQNPVEIAKQGALGGILGVAPEGSALVRAGAAVARTVGAGGIEAGAKLAEGGDAGDAAEAGLTGLAYGLGGEALSRFVSMGGAAAYKGLSRYTKNAQHELSASAGKLSEARQIMETEQPKLPGDAGPNPKYEAAKKQADEATAAIKDHGQNPDDMVHAYEQAKAGTSAGEAAVLRKAASEQAATSAGYDQLRADVRAAGVGAPKANQPMPNGPLSMIRTAENPTGKVEAKFAADAEHAEILAKAPAKDWGEKWGQLQKAGSELIKKRMDFLANGDNVSAQAMDDIFRGVRNQQKAAANYVFGNKPHMAPPPEPGQVRLYRGENSGNKKGGGYFTTDKDMASSFGKLSYVDVPQDVARFTKMPGMKNIYNLPDYAAGPGNTNWRSQVRPLESPGGTAVIKRLESLDKSWAQIMSATAGMNYQRMQSIIQGGNTPARRQLESNFREFAKDDPTAIRAFNAMKAGAQGRVTEETKLLLPLLVGEAAGTVSGHVPSFGAVTALVAGHRVYKIMQEYMNAKVLGTPVKFADFLIRELKRSPTPPVANAAQREMVQQQPGFGM